MGGSLWKRIFGGATNGAPAGGAAFDLLAEKLSRIRYLAEQKTMLDVIEKTPVGICITNEERLFEYVNPAYTRIYGWTWDELTSAHGAKRKPSGTGWRGFSPGRRPQAEPRRRILPVTQRNRWGTIE